MQPLVSICVPVYNVEPYIARCVCSLMEQSYENLEFVFVNDCSTDDSIALLQTIADEYPERKEHIRILHNECNRGLAYTRCVSIENAEGEYIVCVDSDDYIEKDCVEKLCSQLAPDCDLVIGGYRDETETRSEIKEALPVAHEDLLLAALEDRICRLAGKLIRRSLITQFAPEGMNYLEDRIVLLYICGKIRKAAVVNEPLYHYALRRDSVSGHKSSLHFQCLIQYWQLADKYLAERHLTGHYQLATDRQKTSDKYHLLHFCPDVSVCRQYADLFPEVEERNIPLSLPRGKQLTRFLTKRHLWLLLRCYKSFIALKTAKSL